MQLTRNDARTPAAIVPQVRVPVILCVDEDALILRLFQPLNEELCTDLKR